MSIAPFVGARFEANVRPRRGEETEMQIVLLVGAVVLSMGAALVTAAGLLSLFFRLMARLR